MCLGLVVMVIWRNGASYGLTENNERYRNIITQFLVIELKDTIAVEDM